MLLPLTAPLMPPPSAPLREKASVSGLRARFPVSRRPAASYQVRLLFLVGVAGFLAGAVPQRGFGVARASVSVRTWPSGVVGVVWDCAAVVPALRPVSVTVRWRTRLAPSVGGLLTHAIGLSLDAPGSVVGVADDAIARDRLPELTYPMRWVSSVRVDTERPRCCGSKRNPGSSSRYRGSAFRRNAPSSATRPLASSTETVQVTFGVDDGDFALRGVVQVARGAVGRAGGGRVDAVGGGAAGTARQGVGGFAQQLPATVVFRSG